MLTPIAPMTISGVSSASSGQSMMMNAITAIVTMPMMLAVGCKPHNPPTLSLTAWRRLMRLEQLQNGLADALRLAVKRSGLPLWSASSIAPSNHADMIQAYHSTGRLIVWSGASDDTIWGDARLNYLFRAWHDWCHIRQGACYRVNCFLPVHEYAVADFQCIGLSDRLARLVQCEVAEQAKHYERTGQFVTDQITFTLRRMRS